MTGTEFPRLRPDNYRITSPATTDYNCIAWAAGDTSHWWQPGVFWPVSAEAEDCVLSPLVRALESLGYQEAEDHSLELGFEKVALFSKGPFLYTHAARQLSSGKWTSKLGGEEDIEHDLPEVVAGGLYGEVAMYMKRPRAVEQA